MFESLRRRANRSVLVVSEHPTPALFDSEFLRQPEIRMLTAYPDDTAVELARRVRPQLIIEEIEQPGHAGLAFCRDIEGHSATRSIPLILVAGDGLLSEARATSAKVVLAKPVDRKELFDAVRRFVPLPHRRTRRISINLRFTYRVAGRTTQAFSRDLSHRGAFLKTDRLLPLGTKIELRFNIPGAPQEIRCGAIVRCTTTALRSGDPGGLGIEFERLTDDDQRVIERFIEQVPRD